MKRARLAAAFAALLLCGSMSVANAADDMSVGDTRLEEASVTEERLLGSADEATQFAAYQIFTREIVATGVPRIFSGRLVIVINRRPRTLPPPPPEND